MGYYLMLALLGGLPLGVALFSLWEANKASKKDPEDSYGPVFTTTANPKYAALTQNFSWMINKLDKYRTDPRSEPELDDDFIDRMHDQLDKVFINFGIGNATVSLPIASDEEPTEEELIARVKSDKERETMCVLLRNLVKEKATKKELELQLMYYKMKV